MPRLRQAVVVALVTIGLLLPAPASAATGTGRTWPDGEYTISVTTRAAGTATTGEGSGSGGWTATGDFVLEIVHGAGRAPYSIDYVFVGGGTRSSDGRSGSGEIAFTISGEVIAEAGQVRMERQSGLLTYLSAEDSGLYGIPGSGSGFPGVPIAASGTDPLIAGGSSCGILTGQWVGITEGLAAAVPMMPSAARVAFSDLRSTFLAGSTALGDFGLWMAERDALVEEFYLLSDEVGTMRSIELDAAAETAYRLVQRAEVLRNELRTDYCPGYATGEIGISQAMRDLLFAVLGNPSTSPQALADFLAAALRAGALPTGDTAVDRALLDRMVELESVAIDPITRTRLGMAAGALGYAELEDRFFYPEDYYPGWEP